MRKLPDYQEEAWVDEAESDYGDLEPDDELKESVDDVEAPRKAAASAEPPPAAVGRYLLKKLLVGHGQAVINSQLLRCGLFSSPTLGQAMPCLADRNGYRITCHEVSPQQDHLDLLLFAVSRMVHRPDGRHGAPVSFGTLEFLTQLGWTVNAASYERLRRVAAELASMRLTFEDWSRPKQGYIVMEEPLFGLKRAPNKGTRGEVFEARLMQGYFRLLAHGARSVVDLRARAALRQRQFGRWLHGFMSTQTKGQRRAYDAHDLCVWGGLPNARLRDALVSLETTLSALQRGLVERKSAKSGDDEGGVRCLLRKGFAPVVAPGWVLSCEDGRWVLTVARR